VNVINSFNSSKLISHKFLRPEVSPEKQTGDAAFIPHQHAAARRFGVDAVFNPVIATLPKVLINQADIKSAGVLHLASELRPGHHGYQRTCDLISGQASMDHSGPFGSPVFARAGKTDPPSRFILSQTSAWKGLVYLVSRSPSDAGTR
jgi:hypothetical protein